MKITLVRLAVASGLLLTFVGGASAQTDFSGEWTVIRSIDNTENPWIGDFVGLPLSADGLARAEGWDASLLSLPEYRCRPHGWAYIYRGPTQLRITKEVDLAVTTMVDDPQYLVQPYIKTYQFKKQNDATGWNPTPCSAK